MLLIAGPIASRIQAIQAAAQCLDFCASVGVFARLATCKDFMSKTDRAHIEGIVVAKSIDGEIVGRILRMWWFPKLGGTLLGVLMIRESYYVEFYIWHSLFS